MEHCPCISGQRWNDPLQVPSFRQRITLFPWPWKEEKKWETVGERTKQHNKRRKRNRSRISVQHLNRHITSSCRNRGTPTVKSSPSSWPGRINCVISSSTGEKKTNWAFVFVFLFLNWGSLQWEEVRLLRGSARTLLQVDCPPVQPGHKVTLVFLSKRAGLNRDFTLG